MTRAAPVPWGAPGLPGCRVVVRDDLTTEPPAHCRLVSGHDLFEIEAWSDCSALISIVGEAIRGKCSDRWWISKCEFSFIALGIHDMQEVNGLLIEIEKDPILIEDEPHELRVVAVVD